MSGLSIQRNVGESFTITAPDGTAIIITVDSWSQKQVRLEIVAPKNYVVARPEWKKSAK